MGARRGRRQAAAWAQLVPLALIVTGIASRGAAAQGVPRQLYGKTVVYSFTLAQQLKRPDGSMLSNRVTFASAAYLSTEGRIFLRKSRSNAASGRSDRGELAPGAASTSTGRTAQAVFEGGRLVVTTAMTSGAVREVVSFTPGFAGCSVNVIRGKAGSNLVNRGIDGVMYEVISLETVAQSCALKDGNALESVGS
jgi:hypothetical protein